MIQYRQTYRQNWSGYDSSVHGYYSGVHCKQCGCALKIKKKRMNTDITVFDRLAVNFTYWINRFGIDFVRWSSKLASWTS